MAEASQVLLIDDGELDDLVGLLNELGVDFTRLRGGEIGEKIAPPWNLLVTTPRRASAVRKGAPAGAAPGRPMRVVSVTEDSNSMRSMLRRKGFDLLVRRPTHREVWRLLVHRALYQGDERRGDRRVLVGNEADLSTDETRRAVTLIDISNRGCRLLSHEPVAEGARLCLEIADDDAGSGDLRLEGNVLRVSDGSPPNTLAVQFDADLPEISRRRLATLLNSWTGRDSLVEAGEHDTPLPPCESPTVSGFTLDDETDPAISVGMEVAVQLGDRGEAGEGRERRRHPRGPFVQPIHASGESESRVLLGRDLSAGGMRVERLPDLQLGDRFRLAVYGPSRSEPFRIEAKVIRDDGEEGLALQFQALPASVAREIEKIVACLPDVEALQDGEAEGLGSVISEILPESGGGESTR
jgi:predicted RNA-binding protein with TRAM domain